MTRPTSTLAAEAALALSTLAEANRQVHARFPGDRGARQPVHVVYGGAHLFRATTPRKMGALALAALAEHAPDAFALADALALPGHELLPVENAARGALLEAMEHDEGEALRHERPQLWLPLAVHRRVAAKLAREPVEDYRIDFEDGFGVRPEAEEDEHAERAARELALAVKGGQAPPFVGMRIKSLGLETTARAVRTLDLFVTTLVHELGGLPPAFVVTLPKITSPAQPATLAALFERLETRLGLAPRALKMELMVELTQTIFDPEGRIALPRLLEASDGRCTGAHFGSYDYTASCDVTAAWQSMTHPACAFALQVTKNALAGTGVFLSDGATTVMPVGVHRAREGEALTPAQRAENTAAVHAAWRLMASNVTASLRNGFYQGWDLHPAQIPVRYAATYAFFLESLAPAAERLRRFVDEAAKASLVGDVFDDAATGQGLLNHFLRGLGSGAFSERDLASTGLSADEVRTRSFPRILAGRTRAAAAAAPH